MAICLFRFVIHFTGLWCCSWRRNKNKMPTLSHCRGSVSFELSFLLKQRMSWWLSDYDMSIFNIIICMDSILSGWFIFAFCFIYIFVLGTFFFPSFHPDNFVDSLNICYLTLIINPIIQANEQDRKITNYSNNILVLFCSASSQLPFSFNMEKKKNRILYWTRYIRWRVDKKSTKTAGTQHRSKRASRMMK